MELYFASGNENKVKEIRSALPNRFVLKSLSDFEFNEDIPETEPTLEGNALLKARFLHKKFQISVFADDTGLEIDALEGAPGVFSARFAGPEKDSQKNMDKVLNALHNVKDRSAQFRTVIALIFEGKEYLFEGVVKGTIREEQSGRKGFGYDPIFQPDGFGITFAEMDMDTKNKISHRGLAVQKLIQFLNQK